MTHETYEEIRLVYRHWATVLAALDSAREDTLKVLATRTPGYAVRRTLEGLRDSYSLVGELISQQLEPDIATRDGLRPYDPPLETDRLPDRYDPGLPMADGRVPQGRSASED